MIFTYVSVNFIYYYYYLHKMMQDINAGIMKLILKAIIFHKITISSHLGVQNICHTVVYQKIVNL